MAGGQAIDLAAVGKTLNIAELETMHIHKTGALIRTCVQLAALSTNRLNETQFKALDSYAKCIGLSFQIQDDILDVTGDTATLGKKQGSDSVRLTNLLFHRLSVSKLHMKKRRNCINMHYEALSIFGEEADILRYISAWFIERKN